MMMNRDKLGFWVRFVAIGLAAIFLGSFIFLGIGTNINYNLFDLLGGGDKGQGGQTVSQEDRIGDARKALEKNPKDPEKIKALGSLLYQSGRFEDAASVLQEGREKVPDDEEIPILLGQVYLQQAQSTPGDKQKELYAKSGDAFAAATEKDKENADAFLLAGQAYEQAGQKADAIEYYNGYLDLEPDGKQADAVKERISALLSGEGTTPGAGS